MKAEENNKIEFSEEDSLKLITSIIRNTQQNIEEGAGDFMIFWGYFSTFITLLIYFTGKYTQWEYTLYLWWLIPIIGFPIMIYLLKKRKNK